MVVDDEVEVVDDVVEVEAAVVTGVVVLVAEGAEEDETAETSDDVEPESAVLAALLLQPAIVTAMRNVEIRCLDFTPEVWHAPGPLPDQGVGLVSTFNELQ